MIIKVRGDYFSRLYLLNCGDYYPRFCVYGIVNSNAGTVLVQFVFVDLS